MSTDETRRKWLSEHFSYEIQMFRASLQLMHAASHARNSLIFNIALESFAVHVRNLSDFLRNDGGANNFKASDFSKQFKANGMNSIHGTLHRLNHQVFHMGKSRPFGNSTQKFTFPGDAERVRNWIENNLQNFESKSGEYSSEWTAINAALTKNVGLKPKSKGS